MFTIYSLLHIALCYYKCEYLSWFDKFPIQKNQSRHPGGDIMRWLAKDTSLYITEKQYVDTLVVLLVPIAFGDRTKESGNDYEFLSLISSELERQFQGRILLFPTFIYPENPSDSYKEITFTELFHSVITAISAIFFISTKQYFKEQIDAVNGRIILVAINSFGICR